MTHAAFHAGELVMVNIEGRTLEREQAAFLREHRIRAVVLFRENLGDEAEIRALTADLREVMGAKALIAIDQEGGAVVRATSLPQPPSAMALGAAGDSELTERVGAAVARGVRSLGFNWNFAPVLDVNCNPANPVIGERSFSADPVEVARLGRAWMRGALSERVACCVKHFPGHGDTHTDSHRALPVVAKPRDALEAVELAPFRALLDEAPAVMTAHIVYPALDVEYPATLSRAILGRLLREAWGYEGVVITDSLVMDAIQQRYGHADAVALALHAGADMVMALGSLRQQAESVRSIEAQLAGGALALRPLLRARRRIDALAARFPIDAGRYDGPTRAADDQLMRTAWARGLALVGNAVPPGRADRVRVFTQRSVPGDGISEPGPSGARVARLFERFDDCEVVQLDDLRALDWDSVPRDGRTTLVASNLHDRVGPRAARWRPDLHLALWNPFQALDVDAPAVVTWGYAEGALDALRTWLEGGGVAPGGAPVRLNR